MPKKPRIVALTGAAGNIGSSVRKHIGELYDWRYLQRPGGRTIEEAAFAARAIGCDMGDFDGLKRAFEGVDAVVHLAYKHPVGATSAGAGPDDEAVVRQAEAMLFNIQGTYNVFEAARLGGAERIVYASSNHAVGMYELKGDLPIDHTALPRPDGLYGVYKCWAEALGRFFWDQYGISVYCLRIGSVPRSDRPDGSERHLATWQSGRDLAHQIDRCLAADHEGFEIFYGVSRNAARFWDIEHAARTVGYDPQDRAEDHYPPRQSGP